MLVVAIAYAVVGAATAALAGAAVSTQMRTAWRLAAWLLSLTAFIGHVAYEQLRLESAVRATAVHAAAAVALGAFALAAAGPMRAHWGAADFWRASLLSLPLWPVITGVPAFLVALVAAKVLKRLSGGDRSMPSNG